MYWKEQEKAVFMIVLFVAIVFQCSSFFALRNHLGSEGILIFSNILIFGGMVPYAKWVWKTSTYLQAFLRVLKYEGILLVLLLFVAFVIRILFIK